MPSKPYIYQFHILCTPQQRQFLSVRLIVRLTVITDVEAEKTKLQ